MNQQDYNRIKRLYTLDNLNALLNQQSQVAFYGAGKLANGLLNALDTNQRAKVKAILVTDIKNNPNTCQNIRVYQYDDCSIEHDLVVIIAVSHSYRYDVMELLKQAQFDSVVFVSIQLERFIFLREQQLKYESFTSAHDVGNASRFEIYQANIKAMCAYSGIDENKFTKYEALPNVEVEVNKEDIITDFLEQVNADYPITIDNAYDPNVVEWMCKRLRSSDRYGSDNKLYLHYSKFANFEAVLALQDWSNVLDTGKVAFTFDDIKGTVFYHKDTQFFKAEGRKSLAVDEISEFIWLKGLKAHSGNLFLDMILDNHPNLLTLGWLGMSTFWTFYKTFLEGNTVESALNKLSNTDNYCERLLIKANLQDVFGAGTEKQEKNDAQAVYMQRQAKFFNSLRVLLQEYNIPTAYDWFRAVYLAGADVLGRTYSSRITPVILYDYHGFPWIDDIKLLCDTYGRDVDLSTQIKEVHDKFSYERHISIVRDPLTVCGSYLDWLGEASSKITKTDIFSCIYSSMMDTFSEFIYRYSKERRDCNIVRFEDLKLYPRETLQKLCKFLRLPWSDNLLHCTTNGIEKMGDTFNFVGSSYGFSQATVYNKHDRYFSWLDRFRLSLIHDEDFEAWGYKSKVKDHMQYTIDEIRDLFSLPFAFEKASWMPRDVSERLRCIISDMAIEYYVGNGLKCDVPLDQNGEPLFVVRDWLCPQLPEGKLLYE